jgi:DnaJ-class molecular chaperone
MRPRNKKIGSKVIINCPECDGDGSSDVGVECIVCKGTGKIEGVVTVQ